MSGKYTRRSFIKKSATLSAASLAGSYLLPDILKATEETNLDIASVSGKDYYKNTVEAVGMLGEKFDLLVSEIIAMGDQGAGSGG